MKIAIIGCGNRGAEAYGTQLRAQGVQISHLVEPRAVRLGEIARRFEVPSQGQLVHHQAFFALGKVADAVVIATPDDQHVQPCLQALALGYDVLLEKPVCLHEHELERLLKAEAQSEGRVTVCHVLRATAFFKRVKEILSSGALGQLIGIDLLENVGYWHYAHSYVRGQWAKAPPAAPFVLAKSCHDLDLLRWFAGAPAQTVSSQGRLQHFRPEHAPAGAARRCLDCAVQDCPYDARKIYRGRDPQRWPVTVLLAGGLSLEDALREGPYGRCVYAADNDVMDHQTVSITFENGLLATLTVTAFTHDITRTFKAVGSHGELRGHMDRGELERHDFRTGEVVLEHIDTSGHHGGGDAALVRDWLAYLRREAPVPVSLAESLDSHRMAFAAERSR